MTDKEKELVKQYRSENKSYKEIADIIGSTKNIVKCYCNYAGLNGFKEGAWSLENREKAFKERFEKQQPGFMYVSGFTGRVDPIKCQCKVCGHIQERNAQCARVGLEGRLITCDNCVEQLKKATQFKKDVSAFNAQIKSRLIKCKRCGKEIIVTAGRSIFCSEECRFSYAIEQEREERLKEIRICKTCGSEFHSAHGGKLYCSDKCSRKAARGKMRISKDKRLRLNGKVDYSITLHKVISKDSNICYICGRPCNEHDMIINEDGYYIAGNSYPSIDHVIPIAQGGTHSWDNVRLAHRGCNSKKGAKSMYKINQGQVMFSL